jgi:glycerol-3-phosphate dehydrogenase
MFDACIIGAGIVGCAIARELALRGLSVIVIEKHETACKETSSLNSRVIHSGFHEVAGTLKAKLALAGSKQIIEYASARGVPFLRTGMLIAVPYGSIRAGLWREVGALWNLWTQGRRHHIAFRFLTTPGAVLQTAPIRALGGIFIPTVAVIDVEALARSLIKDAEESSARFVFGSEVRAIEVAKTSHVVETAGGRFEARVLVNSAGLGATAISAMAGGPAYDIEFIRGDYYELAGGVARWKIGTLVYPAMPPRSRSKGIHFGPRTDGRLYLGPSATRPSENPPKDLFLAAARKFLPDIRDDDLRWAYSGIRPKLATTGGSSDFVIRLDRSAPPLINLIGIDSPGLSASMAIASHVAEIVLTRRQFFPR